MKYSHQMTYDATPAEVRAMLADRAFREQVCAAMRATRHDVTVEENGAGMRVLVDQTQPANGVPSFAKKFVGEEIQIVQREEWRSATSSSLLVEIPGKPGTLNGSIDLAAVGDRTVETVSGRHQGQGPADRRQARGPGRGPVQLPRCGPRSGWGGPGWPAPARPVGRRPGPPRPPPRRRPAAGRRTPRRRAPRTGRTRPGAPAAARRGAARRGAAGAVRGRSSPPIVRPRCTEDPAGYHPLGTTFNHFPLPRSRTACLTSLTRWTSRTGTCRTAS